MKITGILTRGAAARERLTESQWIAQAVQGQVREVTGHYFIQGNNVQIFAGPDLIYSWSDPIPDLVEVQFQSNTSTTIQVGESAVIYSGSAVQGSASTNAAITPPSVITSVPPIFTGGGYVYSEVSGRGATQIISPGQARINDMPWYFIEGSPYVETDATGIDVTNPFRTATIVSSAIAVGTAPSMIPCNRGNSNINAQNYSAVGSNLQSRSAASPPFALANNLGYTVVHNPATPGSTNTQAWMMQGDIGGITSPTAALFAAFIEVPSALVPFQTRVEGTAASGNVTTITRCLILPMIVPGESGARAFFTVAACCPGWVPAPGHVIAACPLFETTVNDGEVVVSYGRITPTSATVRNTVSIRV